MLDALGYAPETRLLAEFNARFGEYRKLDRTILELAVENSNLKAQRIAFGPAHDAVDAFSNALDAIAPPGGNTNWQGQAAAAQALAAVREIQVLEAPHIAEATDDAMSRLEARMTTSERAARASLQRLTKLVAPASAARLADASAALDRFMDLHAQIVALSRRNTNVRSLALALGQKRMLAAACEESLHAIQEALATRGFSATR